MVFIQVFINKYLKGEPGADMTRQSGSALRHIHQIAK